MKKLLVVGAVVLSIFGCKAKRIGFNESELLMICSYSNAELGQVVTDRFYGVKTLKSIETEKVVEQDKFLESHEELNIETIKGYLEKQEKAMTDFHGGKNFSYQSYQADQKIIELIQVNDVALATEEELSVIELDRLPFDKDLEVIMEAMETLYGSQCELVK